MSNKQVGYLILAFSGLLFAIEVYSLKFLQLIEFDINTPEVFESPFDFLGDSAILIAILITIGVFVFGLCLTRNKKSND